MKKIIFLLALITSLLSPGVFADYMTYGVYHVSCGSWTEVRTKSMSIKRAQAEEWVSGFISGVGYAGPNMTPAPDVEALFAWIDNHCEKNPLDSLLKATKALVDELIVKAE